MEISKAEMSYQPKTYKELCELREQFQANATGSDLAIVDELRELQAKHADLLGEAQVELFFIIFDLLELHQPSTIIELVEWLARRR